MSRLFSPYLLGRFVDYLKKKTPTYVPPADLTGRQGFKLAVTDALGRPLPEGFVPEKRDVRKFANILDRMTREGLTQAQKDTQKEALEKLLKKGRYS